jgi:hypothetical protein
MTAPLEAFPILPAVVAKRYDPALPPTRGAPNVTLKGNLPPWAVLTVIAAIGTGSLIAGNIEWLSWRTEPVWAHGLARDFGIALVTTAALGFTVDRWLKLDIAVDVFKAALGYVLPEEFRDEVKRISEYKVLAEKNILIYDITPLAGTGTVCVVGMLERTVRNIASEPQPYRALIAVDEWQFPNAKSEIQECEIRDESGSVH